MVQEFHQAILKNHLYNSSIKMVPVFLVNPRGGKRHCYEYERNQSN
jgi:hypothetical protein